MDCNSQVLLDKFGNMPEGDGARRREGFIDKPCCFIYEMGVFIYEPDCFICFPYMKLCVVESSELQL